MRPYHRQIEYRTICTLVQQPATSFLQVSSELGDKPAALPFGSDLPAHPQTPHQQANHTL
jgi:hypothetical protein